MITFVSQYIPQTVFDRVYVKKVKPGFQIQKFNHMVIEGILSNGVSLKVVSAFPATRKVMDRWLLKEPSEGIYHYHLCINIPVLKDLWLFPASFFTVLFGPRTAVILDPLSGANSLGAAAACRLRRFRCVGIITDFPEFVASSRLFCHIVNRTIQYCTDYVLLAGRMKERIPKANGHCCIVEGMCDQNITCVQVPAANRRHSILYAGNLDAENGIQSLIDAFLSMKTKGFTLDIYGEGDYQEEVKRIAAANPTVSFHGNQPNPLIMNELAHAWLLVNPRPTCGEFVQYSFPSKTMEYMCTGTPFASTELPSIPAEYFQFIGSLKDGSVDDMSAALDSLLQQDYSILMKKAQQAGQFVLENKNNHIMVRKILQMLGENI